LLQIRNLTTEYRINPLGLDERTPRFSWILESDEKDTVQSSYTVKVIGPEGSVWDTGSVDSAESILVEYSGWPFEPCTRYTVGVEVTDNHGNRASAEGWFETGLMAAANFTANWITHGYEDLTESCSVFRKVFKTDGGIMRARVYVSALGVYELRINGKRVGGDYLSPGWTSYTYQVQYQTYDITELLSADNTVELTVGNGWYAGILGFNPKPGHYGKRTAAIAQIEIISADGEKTTVITDESWQYGTGPRRSSELYMGEVIDARIETSMDGSAVAFDHPKNILISQQNEPVRVTQRLKPVKRFITPKGEVVFDFGQNLVGVIEARLNCPAGTKVVLRHAEVLDKNGNFYTENLRTAVSTDTFICGEGEYVFMPAFTFHGFRYIHVEGLGETPDPDWFTACVMHSDMPEIGSFDCGYKKVNRLWQNIQWGMRGNFLDIPTDCPQRNERLGWTGDAQVFASTAAYNMNTALFFRKWLRDLASEQTKEHGVPHVVPNILGDMDGAAAWSDAAVIIPWEVYQAYGDRRILEVQYESMKAWVNFITAKAGESRLWQSGHQYGDWLALDKEEMIDRVGATDIYMVATAYYAYSTDILVKSAYLLGHTADAEKYKALYDEILAAFRKEYITETGRLVSETQTGCILALHFGLAQESLRPRILQSLKTNLSRHNNHLVTGFVGTPYLCHALSDNGLHGLAGEVFMKEDYPSWLNCVNLGATTIWERWDSMKADGSFDESGMNSFNHYAYGAIGNWMVQKLGGLNIVEPGYKKSRIAPMPIKGITRAAAELDTPYGKLSCAWDCRDGQLYVDIAVPANTTAEVTLPDKNETFTLGSGSYHYEYPTELLLEKERYSMDSTMGEILQNPLSLPMLEKHIPGFASNPMIGMAHGMTLTSMAPMMPNDRIEIFNELIEQLNQAERIDGI
jgi:alpha-L-rhamnosidase